MIVKHVSDEVIDHSPTCGEGIQILSAADYKPFSVAMFIDIKPTIPHFHETFEETYFVIDGQLTLQFWDPETKEKSQLVLNPNELGSRPQAHPSRHP